MADSNQGTKPIKQLRKKGCCVSLFANSVKDKSFPMYKIAMQRTYKKNGEFKHTSSFGRDDIPVIRLLLDKAWETILDLEEKNWKKSEEE